MDVHGRTIARLRDVRQGVATLVFSVAMPPGFCAVGDRELVRSHAPESSLKGVLVLKLSARAACRLVFVSAAGRLHLGPPRPSGAHGM